MLAPCCFLLLLALVAGSNLQSQQAKPVGGWDQWQYRYEPSFLPLPPEANVEHAHGIVVRDDGTIIITYKDQVDESKCLLRWNSSKYQIVPDFLGPGCSLCKGVPHGLRYANENDNEFLYHANNEQALHKTTLTGDIVWSVTGIPRNMKTNNYRPTWFASEPESPYVYMADGYGSSIIYVFHRENGTYAKKFFGGRGSEHGQFETCHAITWDWRFNQMVVCDRENHRLEYFRVNRTDPSVFEYKDSISFFPLLKRPCNIRMRKEDGAAIVPFLEGTVGILNDQNELISVVNITETLGDQGFLHPHDAHFVPRTSGDFILVTWNPGRIGYFRRIEADQNVASKAE